MVIGDSYQGKDVMHSSQGISQQHEQSEKSLQFIFSSLLNVVGGGMDGGGSTGSKRSKGTTSHAKQLGGTNNGSSSYNGSNVSIDGGSKPTTKAVDKQNLPQIVHAPELVDVNGVLARIQRTLRPIKISPSNWTHLDPVEFLNKRRAELECVSKMWREVTIIEVVIPPMVETPALIRSPRGLWKFEMMFSTRLDLEQGVQKIFKRRFSHLVGMNQGMVSQEVEETADGVGPRGCSCSMLADFNMKVLM
ncbi:hypothetical protein MKX01_014852 [Papaver californicum]|nr:hypothetical protein MKX01_014852 [Papaver californicum]